MLIKISSSSSFNYSLSEKLRLQSYNIYNQDDNMDRYHEQDDEYVYTTTTTTALPPLTEYNPSIDMGQYCGACRYYSHRLHVKKYCKRDYSKFKN